MLTSFACPKPLFPKETSNGDFNVFQLKLELGEKSEYKELKNSDRNLFYKI
jgi:hypothetical protein